MEKIEIRNYEELGNKISDYTLYFGLGRRGIGIKVAHNTAKKSLEFTIDILKIN